MSTFVGTSPFFYIVMCCHGNHAFSHNQNGFVFEENIVFFFQVALLNHLEPIRNAPRGSIDV